MALPAIASLWVGAELSWLEQLCLQSFLDNGHEVTLFTYDDVKGVPEGVQMADANDILPADSIIRHAKTGSPAYHADVFRLHMLRQTDYVWADTDAYCCQPWDIKGKHFHGWISDKKPMVNNGVLRLPKTSKTLKAMLKFTSDEYPIPPWYSAEKQAELQALKDAGQGVHVSLLPWGVWGPDALTWFLQETGEISNSRPGHVIYPVPFKQAGVVLNPNRPNQARKHIRSDTLSIHFWGRRFRNIAAKYGGVPAEGCFVHELLAKHGIDAEKSRHLLLPAPEAEPAKAEPVDPATLDFSMFSDRDVANLLLQRTELAKSGQTIRDWLAGGEQLLLDEARSSREHILHGALRIAERECAHFLQAADAIAPKRAADIGCGYAFSSLLMHRRYGCSITLIDIEDSNSRHFGFQGEAAGYASLETARAFLERNGVPPEQITSCNPKIGETASLGTFDLVYSQASCGFHYPVTTYENLFRNQVNSGGGIVLDIRKGSGGIAAMKTFGAVEVLAKHGKYSTVLTRAGQEP
ncbi:class I SAM-dependent methyltransferase [Leisingera daeponensis]|uniref:Class I SAM-dependent methyltransferase n=1 Tax=Leisingera daeponensis TaxID=405746 RepID=A0ABS7NDR3_9RHOB|nr:class I SAM-dependent methyltransferase [Leisingera daeponensis]MBY6139351.1 class I SAM-dependent methyltransferase [Leisingera daeponensis]